jgi:hypothetical protein
MLLSLKFLLICYILSIIIISIFQNQIISYHKGNGNTKIQIIDLYYRFTIFYICLIFLKCMMNINNFINNIDFNNNDFNNNDFNNNDFNNNDFNNNDFNNNDFNQQYELNNNINLNNINNIITNFNYPLIENSRKHTKSDTKLKKENEALKEQIEKLSTKADDINESYLCSICMTNPKNCLITPCNHLAICSICEASANLNTCPYCRTRISSITKVYV